MLATLLAALALDTVSPRWSAAPWLLDGLEPPSRAWTVPAPWTGRLVTRPGLHVGVRGHCLVTPGALAAAVTLQVTLRLAP